MNVLLRQANGLEGLGGVHVPLHANDAPVTHIEDGRGVDHNLDPAALAALVFAVEDNHPVAGIDELSRLDPVLIPCLVVFRIEGLTDLAEATQDFAFLEAPDAPDTGLTMAVFTADAGSKSEQALKLLASWAATPEGAETSEPSGRL